ncbi:type II toxin-antitoxin system HicA family toxin [Devosia neptuniae]|uniref:type II toxin-antitoxin system HicA family toxin n=1 Tax=Devosia neptuniae TaxID=191302 RepID=UPI0036F2A34F
MGKTERLLAAFKECRGPFPYADLVRILNGLGYSETSTSGGSKRKFVHPVTQHIFRFHEPHPGNEILPYLVKQIRDQLSDRGLI